jgi:hypothetical protein
MLEAISYLKHMEKRSMQGGHIAHVDLLRLLSMDHAVHAPWFHGAWYTYYRDSIPYSYLYTRGFFKNIDCFKIAALLLLNLVQ